MSALTAAVFTLHSDADAITKNPRAARRCVAVAPGCSVTACTPSAVTPYLGTCYVSLLRFGSLDCAYIHKQDVGQTQNRYNK